MTSDKIERWKRIYVATMIILLRIIVLQNFGTKGLVVVLY